MKVENEDIVLLHNHTAWGSLLDSMLTTKQMVEFVKNNNMKAIAVTDHGTMMSFVDLYKDCKAANIKPIYGCEVYECDKMEVKEKGQKRYHLILLAKNKKGLQNLFKIVSAGYTIGYYGKPRVDLEYIKDNNLGEGIICLTACMAGRLSRIMEGTASDKYTAEEYVKELKSIFDYVVCELQSHHNETQQTLNGKILQFAKDNNLPYTITCDAHMYKAENRDSHRIFVKIGEEREVGETYEGCYLQNLDQIRNTLDWLQDKDIEQSVLEMQKINNMIEDNIDIGYKQGNQMPLITPPEGFKDNFSYFMYLIKKNFNKVFDYCDEKGKQKRKERLKMEIPILKQLGYIDYFLMLRLLVKEAKKRKIPLGYSRGSGGNCLCLFVLGITKIDSVRWNLDFSRFANLGRQSPADYDMDMSQRRRREMVDVACDIFGDQFVAPICTPGTITTKVAIRDVGKVLDDEGIYKLPFSLRQKVANLIPTVKTLDDLGEEGEEKEELLKNVINKIPDLAEVNRKYPLWFKYVMDIEGLPKSLGRHACFTGDMLVKTDNGYKQIKDIEIGDMVLTHKNRYMPVVDKIKLEDKICNVKILGGINIKCTLNHKFLIEKKDFKDGKIKWKDPKWIEIGNAERLDLVIAITKDGYIRENISSVTPTDEVKTVYNLSVLDDNSYTVNNIVVHNCGTIISPKPIQDYCPICFDSDRNKMLQLEMHNAMDDLNLCKMDFLGLETLDIIDDTLKYAGLTWDDVDINHIDLNDKAVYDNIYKKGNTVGIFQDESLEAVNMCIKAQADNIEDVIAIGAFNRPGTKDGFSTYCENKLHPENATILHEDLRPILEPTHLVLLYQEQALQIFRLAKFPEDQVDNARRAIGHKEKETMAKLKKDFIKGLKKRGWTDNQIDTIWALMAKQASYCFNRGHAVAYGLLSYLTAYLKYHYPVEFMTACLNAKIGKTDKTSILLAECNRMGIKVTPPSITKSDKYYKPDVKNKSIIFGLYPIKDVGEAAADFVIANRPYKGFKDFLDKMTVKGSAINKKGIIALIKSGAIPYPKGKNYNIKLYAKYCIKPFNFQEVQGVNLKVLKEHGYDIAIPKNKELKEKVKQERLRIYNQIRREKAEKDYKEYTKKYMLDFKNKYVDREDMYELYTLNMFLTKNPFMELREYIRSMDDIEDGQNFVMIAAIVGIDRKKDKHNNTFAYLDLYTGDGITEGIVWNSSYVKYQDLIAKGNAVAIFGEKQEDKIICKKFKSFEQWKKDYKKENRGVNK